MRISIEYFGSLRTAKLIPVLQLSNRRSTFEEGSDEWSGLDPERIKYYWPWVATHGIEISAIPDPEGIE